MLLRDTGQGDTERLAAHLGTWLVGRARVISSLPSGENRRAVLSPLSTQKKETLGRFLNREVPPQNVTTSLTS